MSALWEPSQSPPFRSPEIARAATVAQPVLAAAFSANDGHAGQRAEGLQEEPLVVWANPRAAAAYLCADPLLAAVELLQLPASQKPLTGQRLGEHHTDLVHQGTKR